MKHLYLTAIGLLAFSTIGMSQNSDSTGTRRNDRRDDIRESRHAKRRVIAGLKAGINSSNVYDEQGQNFVANSKRGFAGGAFLAIPLGGFLGVQPEVLISQKGFVSSGMLENDSYALKRQSTYLDIPLQLQLKPFRFISILGGIQYSYLLNQIDKLSYGPNSIEHSQDFKNDNIRKNILGVVTGADINIQHIVLSGRLGWDLVANRGDGSSFTPRYKNMWAQATIGFRFY